MINQIYSYSPRNYRRLYQRIRHEGSSVGNTIEILNAHLQVLNPLDRVVTNRKLKMNPAFGIAEWVSMMTGEDHVRYFTPFVQRYADYSTDGVTVDGAYGPRVVRDDQINGVIRTLSADPSSRRAVIAIYEGRDLNGAGGKNTPCTLTLHFLIRRGRLELIASMRSNDLNWGLKYDMFVFSLIQEWIARRLDVPLGAYYHNANSLHVYERDYELFDGLEEGPRWPHLMAPMPKLEEHHILTLSTALHLVQGPQSEYERIVTQIPPYLQDLAMTARAFAVRRSDPASALRCFSFITDVTLRYVLRPWLEKAGTIADHQRVVTERIDAPK